MASGDDSDYDVNFHSVDIEQGAQQDGGTEKPTVVDDVTGQVRKNVAAYMFQAGKEKAKSVLNVYGNIDVLRPYFDVEPHEVRQRLLHSLIPQKPSADVRQRIPRELYGPLMVVFTLVALLLFQMKLADHSVQEGTLMGAAFGVCFGYWFGVSSMMWVLAYVCNTHITILQLMSLIGYSLFGHCVVIFIGTIFHTTHDHAMFYLLWAIFGGLSSLKMVSVLVSRTAGQSQKLVICGTVAALHLMFLLYLHFAYHQTVEGLSTVLDDPVMPEIIQSVDKLEPDVVKRDLHDMAHKLRQKVTPPNLKHLADGVDSIKKSAGETLDNVRGKLSDSVKHVVRNTNYDVAKNMTNVLKQGSSKIFQAIMPANNTNIDVGVVQESVQKAVDDTK